MIYTKTPSADIPRKICLGWCGFEELKFFLELYRIHFIFVDLFVEFIDVDLGLLLFRTVLVITSTYFKWNLLCVTIRHRSQSIWINNMGVLSPLLMCVRVCDTCIVISKDSAIEISLENLSWRAVLTFSSDSILE